MCLRSEGRFGEIGQIRPHRFQKPVRSAYIQITSSDAEGKLVSANNGTTGL